MIRLTESGHPWIPYWMRPRDLGETDGALAKVGQAVENTLKFVVLIVPSVLGGVVYGIAKGVSTSVKNVLNSFRKKVSYKKNKPEEEYIEDRKKDERIRKGADPYALDSDSKEPTEPESK